MSEIKTTEFTRYSRQREAILNYLKSTKSHPSANDVYENVKKSYPNISLGTVYRNLNDLVKKGLAIELKAKNGILNYDGDTSVHSHFVCDCCSSITDVFDYSVVVPSSLDGFQVNNSNTVFHGICKGCLENN